MIMKILVALDTVKDEFPRALPKYDRRDPTRRQKLLKLRLNRKTNELSILFNKIISKTITPCKSYSVLRCNRDSQIQT